MTEPKFKPGDVVIYTGISSYGSIYTINSVLINLTRSYGFRYAVKGGMTICPLESNLRLLTPLEQLL